MLQSLIHEQNMFASQQNCWSDMTCACFFSDTKAAHGAHLRATPAPNGDNQLGTLSSCSATQGLPGNVPKLACTSCVPAHINTNVVNHQIITCSTSTCHLQTPWTPAARPHHWWHQHLYPCAATGAHTACRCTAASSHSILGEHDHKGPDALP
jgi:hypothetical protein